MAEEVETYNQVQTGDPDPLGLEKKLQQVKSKADPLGLEAKLRSLQSQQQPKPEPQQAAFKPMTDWLSMGQTAQPIVATNVVNDHNTKTAESSERIKTHLNDIDNSVRNLLYEHKKDLLGRVTSQNLAVNPREAGPVNFQAQQLAHKDKQDVYVSPVEVESFKSEMPNNTVLMRRGLEQKAKDLAKTNPTEANLLKADIYRLDRQNNPEKESKIASNIDKINKGEYDYDIVNGQLVKPEGFLGSLATGYKEKVQAYDDYGVYKSGDEKAMLDLINKRLKYDPDQAVSVAEEGWLSKPLAEMGRMAGGQPLKPIIGGAAAGIAAGPEAGVAAATAITAPEMYKLTFGAALPQNYAAIKKQHPDWSDSQVLQEAVYFTNNEANIDALSGAAMGVLGAKVGLQPTGLNRGLLQKSLGNALKQVGQETVKKTLEGLGVGAVGASGQLVKNLMAQQEGLPVDASEGLKEQLIGGLKMTVGMTMLAKFPEALQPKTYNQILQAFKNVPKEAVEGELNNLKQSGHITEAQANNAQKAIKEHADIDNSIKPNVPESDRLKVQDKIKKRNELEASLETTDRAYHPDIKEQIKTLNEEIVNLSNGKGRGELQQLVDKESKNMDIHILRDASENDLKNLFKAIADKAHDPNTADIAIATFGENIVNKAKELYPKEQPKVSVIQPGEIKHPETVTISPREQPKEIKSTKNVSVIMPGEVSAGKVSAERVGHVEVSEHGEDTKTAAGKENGIGPSPLTEEGKQEAHKLGQYIADNNKAKIITSEVERGLQTAEEAAKEAKKITGKEVPIERNELLNTANIGSDEGKPEGTFKEKEWFEGKYRPEGSESPESFKARMEKAYEYVKSLPEDTHVVSHSKVMRALDALSKTDGKWTDETTNIFLNNKELTHAIQEPSTGGVLQHPQEGIGAEGGQRGGMEPSQQGEVTAGTRAQEEGKDTGKEGVAPYPGNMDLPFGEDIGIAHEYRSQRAFDTGESAPVRGEVLEPEQYIERGKELIAQGVDPHQVASDFKNHGKIGVDDISVVRAEYNRLVRETNKAADEFGAGSAEDKAAKAAESKWYNEVVKPMQTVWGGMGREQQGVTDIDTGSFTGIRRYFEQRNEQPMSKAQEGRAKELADKVGSLTKEVEGLKKKLTEAIDKSTGEKEPGKSIKEKADKFADLLREGKTRKPGSFQAATPGSLVWDSALEIMAKTVEAGGTVVQAISDGLSHIKQSDWYKSLSEDKQRDVENDYNKYFKNENDLLTRFADKKDNKFTTEDARDIWDYAKTEYINKGKDFNEMVYGVSKDLGLNPDQVRNAITQPKGTKVISDELYTQQYHQRQAIQQAKAWVKAANTPRVVKALKFVPHLFFRLKTFGHGTVGGITHAGMNIFRPTAWKSYWPSFFKQFNFAFGKAAQYEKAMQDLVNDPEFAKWKRAGLAVDPAEKFDDYQTFDKMLGRLGAAGDRGFNALKVMRLEMAKDEYNRLSAVEKADPEVLKEIATIVNHATGTSKIPVPEAIGTAFFAPRLEASRWSRLITQPVKAIATFTNWKNATAAEKAAAKIVAKRSGEAIATYFAALAANQGLLMATGSKQSVNFTDPKSSDWLKFKFGDRTIDLTGGMASALGFLSKLVAISVESETSLKGKTRTDLLYSSFSKYLRGKLSPFASTAADIATHHDYGGNTLPFSSDKPGPFGHQLTWKEYILNQQTPIPVAEAIKDVTVQMEQRGMSKPQIEQILKGVFVGVMSGGTGVRIGEDYSLMKSGESASNKPARSTVSRERPTRVTRTNPHQKN
jgi:probable phosphoglycerate mutase